MRIVEFLALVEEKGFAGLWLPDSVGRGYPTLDPLSILSGLAARPGQIELGTAFRSLQGFAIEFG
jgi:alkanesulfonate monooxygenase SsuD/methylene tetrahydromethanopterin reductase-like flavin-dependent oxidoreductase (luciferase family)